MLGSSPHLPASGHTAPTYQRAGRRWRSRNLVSRIRLTIHRALTELRSAAESRTRTCSTFFQRGLAGSDCDDGATCRPEPGGTVRFSYAESMTDPSFYLPLARAAEAAGYH